MYFPTFLFDIVGLTADGYLEAIPAVHKSLSNPQRLEYWRKLMRPLAEAQFKAWSDRGEPISLFRGMSDLVVKVLLHMFIGPEFAEKHAEELVPIILAYETAIQKPEVRLFPRWATKSGSLLHSTERRFEELIGKESKMRLENWEKYKDNLDLLQVLLNTMGRKNCEGVFPLLTRLTKRTHIISC